MPTTLADRLARAEQILRDCGSVVVGFSGGVDSSLVARLALDTLGRSRVLAVTGLSPAVPEVQRRAARSFARAHGIAHLEVDTAELERPGYVRNAGDRCYHCKSELWPTLAAVARERGLERVADGANADDRTDYRPGARAAEEHGVVSPLAEAGCSKADVRAAARGLGLETWSAPAAPCLASRVAYGVRVTAERLLQVERAEDALRELGFRGFRVRHHGDCARVELAPDELAAVAGRTDAIERAVRDAGFRRVLLDVEGYRQGALNAALPMVTLAAGRVA
ncbi:MAG TPA: ATP-dependent sacrificial sulfur transferase LarE [Longimicrobiales bacterium]|nr:ATP-dependent sacrificial sulfur transferase LarE [Longimicrobiales bacterium]